MELLSHFLQYNPARRPLPLDAMAASFFDPLWQVAGQLNPCFFNLSDQELSYCQNPQIQQWLYSASNAVLQGPVPTMQEVPQGGFAQQYQNHQYVQQQAPTFPPENHQPWWRGMRQ